MSDNVYEKATGKIQEICSCIKTMPPHDLVANAELLIGYADYLSEKQIEFEYYEMTAKHNLEASIAEFTKRSVDAGEKITAAKIYADNDDNIKAIKEAMAASRYSARKLREKVRRIDEVNSLVRRQLDIYKQEYSNLSGGFVQQVNN